MRITEVWQCLASALDADVRIFSLAPTGARSGVRGLISHRLLCLTPHPTNPLPSEGRRDRITRSAQLPRNSCATTTGQQIKTGKKQENRPVSIVVELFSELELVSVT